MSRTWTEAEKKLCIELHNKGVRPGICEGDWIDRKNAPGEISLVLHNLLHFYNDIFYRDNFILLWSWKRVREWLREKGWAICFHADLFNKKHENILVKVFQRDKSSDESKYRDGVGQTDLEAILAVMVQVAEGK